MALGAETSSKFPPFTSGTTIALKNGVKGLARPASADSINCGRHSANLGQG